MLASCSDDKTVMIWDAHTCKPLKTLRGHEGWVLCAAWSPDSRLVASAGYGDDDKSVRVWDAAGGGDAGDEAPLEGP